MERLYIGPSTKVEAHQKKAAWGLVRVWSTRDSLSVVTMEMEKMLTQHMLIDGIDNHLNGEMMLLNLRIIQLAKVCMK